MAPHQFGTPLSEKDFEALERGGIPRERAQVLPWHRVNSTEGAQIVGRNGANANYAGISIGNYLPGQDAPRSLRVRRDQPDLEQKSDGTVKEKAKYLSSGKRLFGRDSLPPEFSPAPESLPPDVAQRLAEMRLLARRNLDLTLAHLPPELKTLPHWVLWRLEARQNKSGDWKITKEPYIAQVDQPRHAASNRPKEWRTLPVALTVLKQDWARKHGGFYDGLGFIFGDSGYSGVDLDHVLRNGGNLPPWAQQLLDQELHDTYVERSIRGEGLHGFLRGTFTGGGIKQEFADGTGFEMYCTGRYFTISGQPYNGAAPVIAERDPQALHDRFKRGEIGPADFRAAQVATAERRASTPKRVVDVAAFLDHHHIPINAIKEEANFTRYSITCPGCGAKDAFIMQHHDGGVSMGCYHASCAFTNTKQQDHWNDFAKLYELSGPLAEAPPVAAIAPVIMHRKLTDLGNAERLVDHHGDNLRWSEEFGSWLTWDGRCWTRDNKRQVHQWARQVVRSINLEAAELTTQRAKLETQLAAEADGNESAAEKLREQIEKLDKRAKPIYAWAKKSEASARIRALVDLARSESGIPILATELDAYPHLFNVENCTIDLKTGTPHDHQREDLLTKMAHVRYVEGMKCPRWLKYLEEIFRIHPDIPAWLQRAVGASLYGEIREHAFMQLYGLGRNGKSTFAKVMLHMFGDYAITVPFAVFTSHGRDGEAPQPFLVKFKGVRMVCAQEPEEGAVFNESLIKTLTGGDNISARTLHEKPIEFSPSHKVWVSGNHKPEIHGTDLGIWSRPRLIPFDEKFLYADKYEAAFANAKTDEDRAALHHADLTLEAALIAELPGILNWAIEGCILWQKDGLGTCPTVKAATEQYERDEDILQPWIDNCCEVKHGNVLRARKGYESFTQFHGGKPPISETAFGKRLFKKGFHKDSDMYGNFYQHIGLIG